MMHKVPNCSDVIAQFLGEGQGRQTAAHNPGNGIVVFRNGYVRI